VAAGMVMYGPKYMSMVSGIVRMLPVQVTPLVL